MRDAERVRRHASKSGKPPKPCSAGPAGPIGPWKPLLRFTREVDRATNTGQHGDLVETLRRQPRETYGGFRILTHILKTRLPAILGAALAVLVTACSPEVGSDEWCNDLKEKDKADWTANEAADFTKNCILK